MQLSTVLDAVYVHFIVDGFISHVLLKICLHCINAVIALRVIWMIGTVVSKLACCP